MARPIWLKAMGLGITRSRVISLKVAVARATA
jgi:hypothetical protein